MIRFWRNGKVKFRILNFVPTALSALEDLRPGSGVKLSDFELLSAIGFATADRISSRRAVAPSQRVGFRNSDLGLHSAVPMQF
jgi:hypothetical protein